MNSSVYHLPSVKDEFVLNILRLKQPPTWEGKKFTLCKVIFNYEFCNFLLTFQNHIFFNIVL